MNSKALFKIPLIYGNYGLCIKHSIFSSSKNIHKNGLSRSCVSLSEQENSISLMLTGNLRFFIFVYACSPFYRAFVGNSWIFQHYFTSLVINFSIDFIRELFCTGFYLSLLIFNVFLEISRFKLNSFLERNPDNRIIAWFYLFAILNHSQIHRFSKYFSCVCQFIAICQQDESGMKQDWFFTEIQLLHGINHQQSTLFL